MSHITTGYVYFIFFSIILWYPIGSYSLIAATPVQSRGGEETTQPSHNASWHNAHINRKPATPMCRRKHSPTGDRVIVHAPGPPQESLESDGTRTSLPAKPSPNLDDFGSIVCRPMGLPVAAGCDTAQDQTQICSTLRRSALDQCATWEEITLYVP
jgi:hypothetical protein